MTLFSRLKTALQLPHKRALLDLQRLIRGQARLQVLAGLAETGLAKRLTTPATLDEIAELVGAERRVLLEDWLALAVGLGVLRRRGDRFALRSATARAIGREDGAAIACFVQEIAAYHATAFRALPTALRGAPRVDYLADYGGLVAGASRIVQPFLEMFLSQVIGSADRVRVLDVGCGTGAYLVTAAQRHAGLHGVAVDLDAAAVAMANENVRAAGLEDRFTVIAADVRHHEPAIAGPFDLVTAFQNVYYFEADERRELFAALRARLAPGGRLAIATVTASEKWISRYFAVLLGSTAGCHPLPTRVDLEGELRDAGFANVGCTRLMPGDEFWGIVATVS